MSSFDQYSSPPTTTTATSSSTSTSTSPSRSTPRRPPLRSGMTYAPPPPPYRSTPSSPIRSFSLPSTPRQSTFRRNSSSYATPTTQGLGLGLAFGSTSPSSGEMGEKEIYMGALVSPVQMNEKRSIDVPCIILTEPDTYLPPSRSASPPPKQIILLPSTSLALPLHSNSGSGSGYDPKKRGWKGIIKTVVVFGAVGFGLWHVWSVLGQFDVEHGHGHGQGEFQAQV